LILDTSGVLAALDGSDPMHGACADAIRGVPGPHYLSPFVLAELDDALAGAVHPRVRRAFLEEVAAGAYQLETFVAADVAHAWVVLNRYEDLDIGLADASVVVLAERHRVWDVLTLDQRRFRAVLGPGDRPFRLLPADA
jgi:predicted nucleic acid-binding protein